MDDDFCVDKIVSRFFLDTCQPRFRVNEIEIAALSNCARVTNPEFRDDLPIALIPLTTGSVAEFYIDPILSCVGDIDIMFHQSNQLAIPAGYSPPTQLPADEFDSLVYLYEMEYIFPSYVYLPVCYLLTKTSTDGTYYAFERRPKHTPIYATHDPGDKDSVHGPACTFEYALPSSMTNRSFAKGDSSLDRVFCMRCLLWPTQAADWPTRRRNYGWPDLATVDRVVNNGCDLVQVAHRLCRDDEWMSKYQWRLSFSRAEIVLINSWTQVQQIMYHMLRVFLKSKRYVESNDSGEKTLSNYHIKTVMLWACELKLRSWWSDDFNNVVEICVELLHVLSVWLRDARCKHYFVSNCNLLNHLNKSRSRHMSAGKLTSVTVESLAKWFVDNYILKWAEQFDCNDSRLFDVVSTNEKLHNAVTQFVYRRHATRSSFRVFASFASTQYNITLFVTSTFLTVRSCSYVMPELEKIGHSLPVYFIAVAFLHVASRITRDSPTDELLDVLATICRLATQMFITSKVSKKFCESLQRFLRHHTTPVIESQLYTSELVELLQQSAMELLKVFHTESREFCSTFCTDFEAFYACKCGDYQRCLQLSTHSVLTLIRDPLVMPFVYVFFEFIQLMDDDIVSLIGLATLVNHSCRDVLRNLMISQLSLSLYLMAQCQMKLHHSATSLAQTLEYVKVACRKRALRYILEVTVFHLDRGVMFTLDEQLLKLVERKIHIHTVSG